MTAVDDGDSRQALGKQGSTSSCIRAAARPANHSETLYPKGIGQTRDVRRPIAVSAGLLNVRQPDSRTVGRDHANVGGSGCSLIRTPETRVRCAMKIEDRESICPPPFGVSKTPTVGHSNG